MRQDNLGNDLRLDISTCSYQSAAQAYYWPLNADKGMLECHRHGDTVAGRRRLEISAVDAVVTQSHALLRLPRKLSGLRRGLNGPSGRRSGRVHQAMLLSGLWRLWWRCAGTQARRQRGP